MATLLEQQAELTEQNRQARIRAHAEYILMQWVAITPTATPQFVIDNAPGAMAAAEQLYKSAMAMVVPPAPAPPPVVVP